MVDLLTLAIPVFILGIGVEAAVGRVTKRKIFRGPDVLADLSLGTMQTLFGIVGGVLIVGAYIWLYDHCRLTTIEHTTTWLVVMLVVQDMLYYWFHRCSHRVNVLWATHAPHHSSEDFNFAVALRQGPVQPAASHLFYLPLAIAGFDVEMLGVVASVNTIYQFFIHTELIGKLGPLEWFLNTPSHHRVHHGCNGRYIDRNHGGMLIVWDRLFGTFEPEADRPVYGTVKQVTTWNPVLVALQPFRDIIDTGAKSKRLVDKLRVWFMPPEWVPAGATLEWPDVVTRPKFNARPASPAASVYVTVMFVLTLVVVVLFLFVGASTMATPMLWASTVWLVFSLGNLGAILDGKAWAKPLEIVRLAALVVLLAMNLPSSS